ncbi:MAG: hypothetical protein M3384_05550 [Acidobacteriota bacterium]|nr:hypothetical protein [Acidobacteriota bacterium]
MLKTVSTFILIILFLSVAQIAPSQQSKPDAPREKPKIELSDESRAGFYRLSFLESDFRQVDVVAYVDVKERKLEDFLGGGDNGCESDKGTGYCLYRLKAELKEVFKGGISGKTIEFYASMDMDYPKKYLLGEKVVFLNWSDNYPDKNRGLGTIENSTREIKFDILKKMRKIAREKAKPEKSPSPASAARRLDTEPFPETSPKAAR